MLSSFSRCVLAFCLVLLPQALLAADQAPDVDAKMVGRINRLIRAGWDEAGVTPAQPATDAEFLRRAYLDATGRLPAVSEVRRFLDDSDPQRRSRLIAKLVRKPNHATHLARTWRGFLVPQGADLRLRAYTTQFENWLRIQFAENRPYNETVRELLTAKGQLTQNPAVFYYTSLLVKPEEVAASVSRSFLGTQIQCAQCHDHPFDHWKQKDFWGFAAFFARISSGSVRRQPIAFQVTDSSRGEVKLPGTNKVIPPRFLQDASAEIPTDRSRRESLADWLVAGDNPFFARATANRVWANLFGQGIVSPVDDLGSHNEPSHPQLLTELAEYFVEIDFDLRRLYSTLMATEAYQLSSRTQDDLPAELFAAMTMKPLTGAQLYDCIADATWKKGNAAANNRGFGFSPFDRDRQSFVEKFRAGASGEYQAGIPQALTMMNGQLVQNATGLQNSDILISLTAPLFTMDQRVEILFLSSLSRLPSDKERKQFFKYVKSRAPSERPKAYGDILWALLNSAEFTLNH